MITYQHPVDSRETDTGGVCGNGSKIQEHYDVTIKTYRINLGEIEDMNFKIQMHIQHNTGVQRVGGIVEVG